MELSIIIPVYNVVKWLERCVLSVVSQGLVDYEVILVDDGSTDGSGALCDELCHQYESLKVIHQPNGGLSAARNAGMAAAKGRYITFVDSDDELCPNTLLENLECLLRNPEVDMLEYPIEVHAGSADAHTLAFQTRHRTRMFSSTGLAVGDMCIAMRVTKSIVQVCGMSNVSL